MALEIHVPELISELVMEILLAYLAYLFWKRYRRTSNRGLLTLAITFGLLLVAHTIWPVIMEDILGYSFPEPFEPHHIFFTITLVVLIYLAGKTQWRVRLQTPKPEDKEKAA